MLFLNILVWLVTGYIVVGIILASILSFTQIHKIDPAARRASLGFRLIVLPGLAMLWPLIVLRVVRGASPPTEKTAHKKLWESKS